MITKQKQMIENGRFFFYEGTPVQVMNVINSVDRDTRLRFWYGKDGKAWDEENDITGYVGRSTGVKKIPLLVHNSTSTGGGAIITDCIVKIVETKTNRVLYIHPNFSQSVFTRSGVEVYADGVIYGRCKSEESAQRLADFMNGKRHSK